MLTADDLSGTRNGNDFCATQHLMKVLIANVLFIFLSMTLLLPFSTLWFVLFQLIIICFHVEYIVQRYTFERRICTLYVIGFVSIGLPF